MDTWLTGKMKVIIGIIIGCILYTIIRNNWKTDKEEYCYELLLHTKKLLDDNNIDFFLDYGTLLGAYRDNQFIPHDTDIDISIYNYDKVPKLLNDKNILRLYNLQLVRNGKELHSLKLLKFKDTFLNRKLKHDNEIYIDIYKVYFQPTTDQYMFYDTLFKIPTNTGTYLEYMYGDTWKTPIKGKHGSWPSSSKTIKNTEWFTKNVIEHTL